MSGVPAGTSTDVPTGVATGIGSLPGDQPLEAAAWVVDARALPGGHFLERRRCREHLDLLPLPSRQLQPDRRRHKLPALP